MPNIKELIRKRRQLKVAELIGVIQDLEKLISGLENKIKEKDKTINRMIGIKKKG